MLKNYTFQMKRPNYLERNCGFEEREAGKMLLLFNLLNKRWGKICSNKIFFVLLSP